MLPKFFYPLFLFSIIAWTNAKPDLCNWTPDPNVAQECQAGCKCFSFAIIGVNYQDDSTQITVNVTNSCRWHTSFVAIGIPSQESVQSPAEKDVIEGSFADYQVEYTNSFGLPGFTSVKFEVVQENGFKNGASESFTISLHNSEELDAFQFSFQGKAILWETFTDVPYKDCNNGPNGCPSHCSICQGDSCICPGEPGYDDCIPGTPKRSCSEFTTCSGCTSDAKAHGLDCEWCSIFTSTYACTESSFSCAIPISDCAANAENRENAASISPINFLLLMAIIALYVEFS